MFLGTTPWYLLPLLLSTVKAERWRFPESRSIQPRADTAASVRIDTKVRFVDEDSSSKNNKNTIQSDELSAQQASESEEFFSRPSNYRQGNNRYPSTTYRPMSDGTLDSVEQCKCVSNPDCNPRPDPSNACKSGQYLCCYKRPIKSSIQNSEYLNEIENDAPRPFNGRPGAPFLPNNNGFGNFGQNREPFLGNNINQPNQPGVLVGPGGPAGQLGPPKKAVLVGPEGPTGHIGPGPQQNGQFFRPNSFNEGQQQNPGVLVGPGGQTRIIGQDIENQKQNGQFFRPNGFNEGPSQQNPGVLVGPGGPTGIIGPDNGSQKQHNGQFFRPNGFNEASQQNPGVLVGPGGPTGIIGPDIESQKQQLIDETFETSGTAQRGVLVGPGGPTGVIGPYNRPVLVGPGGPTGIIGPNRGYNRGLGGNNRGVLVGPGGPTGVIGPGYGFQSRVLVGPGGPTGRIGPDRRYLGGGNRNYF